jgi:hypothetical protein
MQMMLISVQKETVVFVYLAVFHIVLEITDIYLGHHEHSLANVRQNVLRAAPPSFIPFRLSRRLPLLVLPLFTVRIGHFEVAVS